jgi:flagellar biosynthesis/type III secretory pathway chaperone
MLDLLEDIESNLVDLTECLQKEREYVTVFDISNLLETLDRKHKLLERFRDQTDKRQEVFEAVWREHDLDPDNMPEKIPAILRQLSDARQTDAEQLEKLASRFEALMDVIWELREVNQSLVHRSLEWLDAYIDDISTHVSSSTYDSSGEMKRPSFNVLRSMV